MEVLVGLEGLFWWKSPMTESLIFDTCSMSLLNIYVKIGQMKNKIINNPEILCECYSWSEGLGWVL